MALTSAELFDASAPLAKVLLSSIAPQCGPLLAFLLLRQGCDALIYYGGPLL